uniref:H15 domain-containing protein n=1 Tax=Clastoptera arizonana TaxID=38151 RepID=A0A1B6DPI1_9HEMI
MVSQKKLVSAVSAAVKGLKDRKGSSLKAILSFVKTVLNTKTINKSNIILALNKAVSQQILKETKAGKYKLNVMELTKKDLTALDQINKDVVLLPSKCSCLRKFYQNRSSKRKFLPKRRPKRHCTPIWEPRERNCRSQTRSVRRKNKRCAKRKCTSVWEPRKSKRACKRRPKMAMKKLRRRKRCSTKRR